MFNSVEALHKYIVENYHEITDQRIDEEHWDLECTHCKIARGFQVFKRTVAGTTENSYSMSHFRIDYDAPTTYLFRCPVCKAFKQWIVYELEIRDATKKLSRHFYKVTSIPGEGLEEIDELPSEPPSLRVAYRQAIRAMDANAPLAAAAMFRRALQVITRQLLGATPGNLAFELKQVVGRRFNGIVLTADFANVGYIVKEAGNQGAHPDKDADLLDFTLQDAQDLQSIFMELVSELFIAPAAVKKAKGEFLQRRKISPKP